MLGCKGLKVSFKWDSGMDCVSRDLGLRIFFVFLITFLPNPLCSLCSASVLYRFPKVFTIYLFNNQEFL